MSTSNRFLAHGDSDQSGPESDNGYDSEANEISRTERRGTKRRKLSHSSNDISSDDEPDTKIPKSVKPQSSTELENVDEATTPDSQGQEIDYTIESASTAIKASKKASKKITPGVIYLSSLPPYLKPSALRNILAQRGFEPISRLFLAPSSKHKHSSKKNSRQLYSEGWIEFASKKVAKQCAEALNAQLIGGKKGSFYRDDLFNMTYLRGMSWEELMAGIREEKREEEGRRDEERRRINKETEVFVRGVERGKQLEGMKKKRKKDGVEEQGGMQWKQHEGVKVKNKKSDIDPKVKSVLAQIF